VALVLGSVGSGLTPIGGDQSVVRRQVRRVVLDPARGGADEGAWLDGGAREKWLALELARLVSDRLRAAGYEVFLTRDEDRALTPEERAAFANETGADLFLSLAFEPYEGSGLGPVQCIVHRPAPDDRRARSIAGYRLVPWDRVQLPHLDASESLARWILEFSPGDAGSEVAGPVSLPLRLLQGLDMPSVAVVISTAVTDAEIWSDWRQSFARSLVEALDAFAGTHSAAGRGGGPSWWGQRRDRAP
jgi:N-acetylmuramoyl-L-alanine amidase